MKSVLSLCFLAGCASLGESALPSFAWLLGSETACLCACCEYGTSIKYYHSAIAFKFCLNAQTGKNLRARSSYQLSGHRTQFRLAHALYCLVHLTASILLLALVRTAAAADVIDYSILSTVPFFNNLGGGTELPSLGDETATFTADIVVTPDNVRSAYEFRLQPLSSLFRPLSTNHFHLRPLSLKRSSVISGNSQCLTSITAPFFLCLWVPAQVLVIDGHTFIIESSSGNSYSMTRAGSAAAALFKVMSSGVLTLDSVSFSASSLSSGGVVYVAPSATLTVTSSLFKLCNATGFGGAVMNAGDTTLIQTNFDQNVANTSGHVHNTGTLTVAGGEFSRGYASTTGGAIANFGILEIANASFSSNTATTEGGDIYQSSVTATFSVTGVTTTDSKAQSGSGGSIAVLGGSATVATTILTGCSSFDRGGAIAVESSGVLTLTDVSITDFNFTGGIGESSQGGAIYVAAYQASGTAVYATRLTIQGSPSMSDTNVGQGGGIFMGTGTTVDLSDFTCDSIKAANGPCIFASGSCTLTVAEGRVVNNYGWEDLGAGAAVYLTGGPSATLSGMTFRSNTLNLDQTSGHKGAAMYVLGSTVTMTDSVCSDHTVQGDGGCFYVESASTLTLNNVSFYNNFARFRGGAIYAFSSTVTINGGTATNNKCLKVGSSGAGAGGVLYATTMYALTLSDVTWSYNEAVTGGAINLLSVKEGDFSVVTGVDTRDDYYGARIFNSVFEGNVAKTGGAISTKQTFLWAKLTRFTDNVATTGLASALDMAFDAIFQLCTIENMNETAHNGTMVEVYRGVFDNSTVRANKGIAIDVNLDSGNEDVSSRVKSTTYPILSRNSDLSEARINIGFANGYWDWMKCLDSTGAREKWFIDYDIPDLLNYGISFKPACPTTATCVDDYERRTLTCLCPAGSFHKDIINKDMACTEDGASYSPTPMPQVKIQSTGYKFVESGPNRTFILADYNPVLLTFSNLFVAMSSDEVDVYTSTLGFGAALLACGVIAMFLSLLLDFWLYDGVPPDTREGWLLWWMQYYPSYFHIVMGVDRKAKRQWIESFDPDAESKAKKKKKKQKKKEGEKNGKRERTKQEMKEITAATRGSRNSRNSRNSREDAETKDNYDTASPILPGPEGRLATRRAAKQHDTRTKTL